MEPHEVSILIKVKKAISNGIKKQLDFEVLIFDLLGELLLNVAKKFIFFLLMQLLLYCSFVIVLYINIILRWRLKARERMLEEWSELLILLKFRHSYSNVLFWLETLIILEKLIRNTFFCYKNKITRFTIFHFDNSNISRISTTSPIQMKFGSTKWAEKKWFIFRLLETFKSPLPILFF